MVDDDDSVVDVAQSQHTQSGGETISQKKKKQRIFLQIYDEEEEDEGKVVCTGSLKGLVVKKMKEEEETSGTLGVRECPEKNKTMVTDEGGKEEAEKKLTQPLPLPPIQPDHSPLSLPVDSKQKTGTVSPSIPFPPFTETARLSQLSTVVPPGSEAASAFESDSPVSFSFSFSLSLSGRCPDNSPSGCTASSSSPMHHAVSSEFEEEEISSDAAGAQLWWMPEGEEEEGDEEAMGEPAQIRNASQVEDPAHLAPPPLHTSQREEDSHSSSSPGEERAELRAEGMESEVWEGGVGEEREERETAGIMGEVLGERFGAAGWYGKGKGEIGEDCREEIEGGGMVRGMENFGVAVEAEEGGPAFFLFKALPWQWRDEEFLQSLINALRQGGGLTWERKGQGQTGTVGGTETKTEMGAEGEPMGGGEAVRPGTPKVGVGGMLSSCESGVRRETGEVLRVLGSTRSSDKAAAVRDSLVVCFDGDARRFLSWSAASKVRLCVLPGFFHWPPGCRVEECDGVRAALLVSSWIPHLWLDLSGEVGEDRDEEEETVGVVPWEDSFSFSFEGGVREGEGQGGREEGKEREDEEAEASKETELEEGEVTELEEGEVTEDMEIDAPSGDINDEEGKDLGGGGQEDEKEQHQQQQQQHQQVHEVPSRASAGNFSAAVRAKEETDDYRPLPRSRPLRPSGNPCEVVDLRDDFSSVSVRNGGALVPPVDSGWLSGAGCCNNSAGGRWGRSWDLPPPPPPPPLCDRGALLPVGGGGYPIGQSQRVPENPFWEGGGEREGLLQLQFPVNLLGGGNGGAAGDCGFPAPYVYASQGPSQIGPSVGAPPNPLPPLCPPQPLPHIIGQRGIRPGVMGVGGRGGGGYAGPGMQRHPQDGVPPPPLLFPGPVQGGGGGRWDRSGGFCY
uniref:Uncharacterized protein n=1 Tax=Chromera velia CCMP2878 TaxID=1169474 RepID=A0A0G4HKG3_9ALVE|eukprot:Cvel_28427.t1-p1 / transcript=Cvel_28427.t1 / gene=Cvel_28427 / organism=Chromera_velia_CCMP2878 / gene_product=hypothetical protein / transcript_product=hypothetical protein / location=Cvel_scaffold3719:6917-10411(+) / protein_length=903 / sequence_SO=supercontig / SO=protein_coding / is_pseudo=false